MIETLEPTTPKTSTQETGHQRNLLNFDLLINGYVRKYGTIYEPSNQKISIEALCQKYKDANNVLADIKNMHPLAIIAIDERQLAIDKIDSIVTRVNSALRASDVNEKIIEDVQSIVDLIKGNRKSERATEEEKEAAKLAGNEIVEHSSSRLSYDYIIENFEQLVKMLCNIPAYKPNQPELSLTELIKLQNDSFKANLVAKNLSRELEILRGERDKIFYDKENGLVALTVKVKTYVKSLFSADSNEYKEIVELDFKQRTIKH